MDGAGVVTALVVVIAVVESLIIGLFVALALSGDDWGIARAVAAVLAVPFTCLTLPALVLLRAGKSRAAAALAVASVPALWLGWRFA